MNKLPVGQTIRFAYAFTFAEIGTVIGLIWIPALINVLAGFFATRAYYQALADSIESAVPLTGATVLLPFVTVLVSTLTLAMIGVAIVRQALGLRKGPAFAHFSFGAAELRVFGGLFMLYMLLVLVIAVFAIATLGTPVLLGSAAGAAPASIGFALAALAGLCALFTVTIRLSFVMVPAALESGAYGLTQSWALTKGNFWRIFAVGLTTLLPILLIVGLGEIAILGPDILVPDLGTAKGQAAELHRMAAQLRSMQGHLPLLMGLSFVVSPLMYGLMFAPAAFAWRVLSGKPATEHTA